MFKFIDPNGTVRSLPHYSVMLSLSDEGIDAHFSKRRNDAFAKTDIAYAATAAANTPGADRSKHLEAAHAHLRAASAHNLSSDLHEQTNSAWMGGPEGDEHRRYAEKHERFAKEHLSKVPDLAAKIKPRPTVGIDLT